MFPELLFPNLSSTPYHVTSPADPTYNCFSWAAGESHRWWEAHPDAGHFWPTGHTTDWSIDIVIDAYRTIGYAVCDDGSPESGVEKVVIYVKDGEPTHAARQLPSGMWTSKLGAEDDLEHTLDGLTGAEYGAPVVFLKRTMPAPS
jgi:hypothetical protein